MSERDAISEDAVEAAVKAVARVAGTSACQKDTCPPASSCYCRQITNAALEAALPLVVAGERERCAKISTSVAKRLYALDDVDGALACLNVSAAIRADKEGETGA